MIAKQAIVALFAVGSIIGPAAAQGSQIFVLVDQATSSAPTNHPEQTVLPSNGNSKLIGGGGFIDWTGYGSLLNGIGPMACPPENPGLWMASGKDHSIPDPALITAYALFLFDRYDSYEVVCRDATSLVTSHPHAKATLPPGYVMTGGGCKVNWPNGAFGSLLTGSVPDQTDNKSWICDAKDHLQPSRASVTASVIGIKPRHIIDDRGAGLPLPLMRITKVTSASTSHAPTVAVTAQEAGAAEGYVITGGGASAEPQAILRVAGGGAGSPGVAIVTEEPGVLLTASRPIVTGGMVSAWEARAKDHGISSPGWVTAYAVSLKFLPGLDPEWCGNLDKPETFLCSGGKQCAFSRQGEARPTDMYCQ